MIEPDPVSVIISLDDTGFQYGKFTDQTWELVLMKSSEVCEIWMLKIFYRKSFDKTFSGFL